MLNTAKCNVSSTKLLDCLVTAAVCLSLVIAALLLPLPWDLPAQLAEPAGVAAGGTVGELAAAVELALLGASAVAVWGLLLWLVVIGALAAVSRVPGAIGVVAGRVLAGITPGIIRRTLAVGISVGALTSVAAGTAPTVGSSAPGSALGADRAPAAATVLQGTADRIASVGTDGRASVGAAATGPTSELARDVAHETARVLSGVDRPAPTRSTAVLSGTVLRGVPSPTSAPTSSTVDVDWPVHPPTTTAPVDLDWPESAPPVVVKRGDTLWSIAAERLGADASDARIDQEWHRWYAANRAVIGDDPNLILPGQQLTPPR